MTTMQAKIEDLRRRQEATYLGGGADKLAKDAEALLAAVNGDSDADVETLAQKLSANTAQFKLALSNTNGPTAAATAQSQAAANTTTAAQAGGTNTVGPDNPQSTAHGGS